MTARLRLWCCDATEWPRGAGLKSPEKQTRNDHAKTKLNFTITQEERAHREATAEAGVTTGECGRWGFGGIFHKLVQKLGARILKKKERSSKQTLWAHSGGRACEKLWSTKIYEHTYLIIMLWIWVLCLDDVCALCVFLVSVEARRWHWFPGTWV